MNLESHQQNKGQNLMTDNCSKLIQKIKDQDIYDHQGVINSPQGVEVTARNGKKILQFSANNYLGLANHPRLNIAAKEAIDNYGFGMATERKGTGTLEIHKELEAKVSQFHKMEDTILYASCFEANGTLFETLLDENDVVFSDELNHASIIDGIRLCKAKKQVFAHNDMTILEEQLKKFMDKRVRLIAVDGVFSMVGDLAPLPEILALAKKYDAIVFIDECHGTGIFGKTGRGIPEYFGVEGQVDIINSSFGKALGGGTGGFTCASKEIVDVLRQRSRHYAVSNPMIPSVVGATIEAFKMLDESRDLIDKLKRNSKRLRSQLVAAGFTMMGVEESPIAPIWLGDTTLCRNIQRELYSRFDIYIQTFAWPVVEPGQGRLRISISGGHTDEQIDYCCQSLITIGREKGVIPNAKM